MSDKKEKKKTDIVEQNKSVMVNITTDEGKSLQLDLSKSSDIVRGLYTRALELKREQVRLETSLVENNILINDYINRIVDINEEKKDDGESKE
tara:strand:- start:4133 stop:4411 length:279 start_codon:yes stop_codon:yes gene_type:complete